MLIARPDLVHMDRAGQESGADLNRHSLPEDVYTGIWWYARFPNHYSGEGAAATKGIGRVRSEGMVAPDRRSAQGDQGRPGEPEAAKPVLRGCRSIRWTPSSSCSGSVASSRSLLRLGRPMAVSCFGKLAAGALQLFLHLGQRRRAPRPPGSDLANSASESFHCAAASRMRPVFS